MNALLVTFPNGKADRETLDHALTTAIRVHGNFIENVSIAFLFASAVERNGVNQIPRQRSCRFLLPASYCA
jgi:uncharacterized membrane protein YecN with MAPEG domain